MHVTVVFAFIVDPCGDAHDYKENVGEAKSITISQKSRADKLIALIDFDFLKSHQFDVSIQRLKL